MNKVICVALLIGSVLAAGATAEPVFFATQGTTLFRVSDGGVDSFTLSDVITALSVAPDGTFWGTSFTDDDGDGLRELYTLANPFGDSPALVLQGDFLEENTPSITFIDSMMYGFQKDPDAPPETGVLVTIDPDGQTQALVGDTGSTGIAPGGSAYDPVNDVLYAMVKHGDGQLFTVDYDLEGGTDPTGTSLGSFDLAFGNNGAEYYDGLLYMVSQLSGDGPLSLGVIAPDTVTYTELLQFGPPAAEPIGLAVIPEPATLLLLGLGACALARRR